METMTDAQGQRLESGSHRTLFARSPDVRVSAILVINDRPASTGAPDDSLAEGQRVLPRGIACAEIMGKSVLERTATRLRKAGVQTISVIGGPVIPSLPRNPEVEITVADNSIARWLAAQQTLLEHGTKGIDIVLMIGLGAYLECNVAEALKFHLSTKAPLTQLEDDQGALDYWVVDSKWFRTAATGCKLPFRYGEFPGLPVSCPIEGYVNRLAGALDLRRLVLDAFLGRCEIAPSGREVRPGIWLDEGARVHARSRLVAPVYVGRRTTVGAAAVITRFSNLERDCRIGDGTVVDQATVLPHTALGDGLDVSHAVVDGNRFADLSSNVTFQMDDPRLLCDNTPSNVPVPRHRKFVVHPEYGAGDLRFEYSQGWSRVTGRLAEVFFKG